MEDVEVHLHAFQTMTEQFQMYEWGHGHLGKVHHCSEITSRSWDAPDYTQPVHILLHCSNSAMKFNNGTNEILYNDIAVETITEPPPCFTLGTRHSAL
jgi:hypothetical protein